MSHAAPTPHRPVGTHRGLRTTATALGAAIVATALTLAVVNATGSSEGSDRGSSVTTTSTGSGGIDFRPFDGGPLE